MAGFDLTLKTDGIDRGFARILTATPIAVMRSLNRAIASGRSAMTKAIAGDVGLKQAAVREQLVVTEATPQSATARLTVRGGRIALVDFNAKGPMPTRGRGRGVTYRIGSQRKTIPNAFLARMRNGHIGVFVRIGSKSKSVGAWSRNLPIDEKFGPSLPHVFRKFLPVGQAQATQAFLKELPRQLKYALTSSA